MDPLEKVNIISYNLTWKIDTLIPLDQVPFPSIADTRRKEHHWFFFFLSLFIYFESEREREWRRSRDSGERVPSRLHAVIAEPDAGLYLVNTENMTWAEINSRTLDRLSHPGAPEHQWFFKHQVDTPLFQAGSVCLALYLLHRPSPPCFPPLLIEMSIMWSKAVQGLWTCHLPWHMNKKQTPLGREWGQWRLVGHILGRAQACLQCSRSLWNRSLVLFGVTQEGKCLGKWSPLHFFFCQPNRGHLTFQMWESNTLNTHFGDVFPKAQCVYLLIDVYLFKSFLVSKVSV